MIDQIVGNYKITQKLGEGGMGAVFKGVDLMLEREVAIKALRPELAAQPQIVERFRSEAVTLAKLNHPNIAALYSFFRQGDEFFMVMEFMEGNTLDDSLRINGAMTSEQAIPLFSHALEGVGYAHKRGIVHRDIKPSNMMLTTDGLLKVMDFGIARVLGSARMTKAGHLIGTIEYMSPEQVRGQDTDARSDIYSLGMLLYEMLTGQVPFASDNEYELMRAQIEQTPRAPRELMPDIPESVETAILRAIAKNPDERFQSAHEFRNALAASGLAIDAAPQTAQSAGANTGSRLSPQSIPPVSGTHTVAPQATDPANAKATRLAASTDRTHAASAAGAKETRLGASAVPPAAAYDAAQNVAYDSAASAPAAPASFLSRLTWVHYAGAGAGLVVILGAVLVSVLALGGGGGSKEPASPAVADKPAVAPAALAPSSPSTPAPAPVETAAQPASAPAAVPEAIPAPNSITLPAMPGAAPTTAAAKPDRSAPVARSEERAAKPSAPKPAPRSDGGATAAERERQRKAAEARRLLDADY